jgi:ABC-2 type transport system permease protein
MTATVPKGETGTGDAVIHERGYRRYEGERAGWGHAVGALSLHTFQRIMGLRRPARHKVLPFLSVIIAYLPAAVFVGVIALFPQQGREARITYGHYYGFVTGAILLFVTFAAPEALCPDRRWRTLSLYLASPLDRMTYVLAKAIAIVAALALVTIGPLLLLLIGFVLQNEGPRGPGGVLLVFVRILGAGAVLSVMYAALSMAISSVTDRRAFAGAATFLFISISHALAGFLGFGLELGDSYLAVSMLIAPVSLVQYIYGEAQTDIHVPLGALVGSVTAVTLLSAAFVMWRYRNLQVTR